VMDEMGMEADREELAAIAATVCAAQGVELYWLDYKRSGRQWQLTVYIDKPGGVTIADCERVSRALEPEFDARIEHSYVLIVSSPGLDRELHTAEHFRRAVGEEVQLKLRRPIGGQRAFQGKLMRLEGEELVLETSTGPVRLSLGAIAHARVIPSLAG